MRPAVLILLPVVLSNIYVRYIVLVADSGATRLVYFWTLQSPTRAVQNGKRKAESGHIKVNHQEHIGFAEPQEISPNWNLIVSQSCRPGCQFSTSLARWRDPQYIRLYAHWTLCRHFWLFPSINGNIQPIDAPQLEPCHFILLSIYSISGNSH